MKNKKITSNIILWYAFQKEFEKFKFVKMK